MERAAAGGKRNAGLPRRAWDSRISRHCAPLHPGYILTVFQPKAFTRYTQSVASEVPVQEFGWRYALTLIGAVWVVALVCVLGLTVASKVGGTVGHGVHAMRQAQADLPAVQGLKDGDLAVRAKDYARAIERYSAGLAAPSISSGNRRNLLVRRAVALEWEKRYGEAEADLTAALAIEPVDQGLYAKRGAYYLRRNRHQAALADFTAARTIKRNDAALAYDEARAHAGLHAYGMAAASYSDAIRLKPDMMRAYLGRASAYGQLKMHREARADYDHVIADHEAKGRATKDLPAGEITNAYLWRGQMNSHLGDYARAKDDFDKVLAESRTLNGLKWRGYALERMGEKEQALADYRAALALAEQDKWLTDRIKKLETP